MADLAEILMVEHAAIRHIRKGMESDPDYSRLDAFHDYLQNCHIEIEERILFPAIIEISGSDFREEARRIMADHKLIQALFTNLSKWYESQDMEKFHARFPMFFSLLQEHNDREDSSVFPHWASIGKAALSQAKKEAASIISSFGMKSYLEVTGLTESGYVYLMK